MTTMRKIPALPAWLWLLPALAAAGVCALAARCGAAFFAPLWGAVCALLAVGVPGALAVRGLQNRLAAPLRAPAAAVFGLAAFTGVTVLASALKTPLPARVWLALCAAAAGLWLWRRRRAGRGLPRPTAGTLAAALLWGALALVSAAGAGLLAHPAAVGQIAPSQDFFWNLGNAESFFAGFPPTDLRFAGVTLTYHYLTELLGAGLSMASGLPVYDVLAFCETPLLLALAVFALRRLGAVVFDDRRAGTPLLLAGVFVLACGSLTKAWPDGQSRFWNTAVRHVMTNINGQTTAVCFLALFVTFFVALARGGFADRLLFAPALLAFAGLCFAKGPEAGIIAIAAPLACLLGLPRRGQSAQNRLGALAFALLVGGGFALLYRFYFAAGAGSSMTFSLTGTLSKSYFGNLLALAQAKNPALAAASLPLFWLAQSFCMAPAAFPLWLGAALRDLRGIRALPAERLFLHAAAVGGLAAFFLFDHASMSQIYFGFLGLFFVDLLAAEELCRLWRHADRRRAAVRLGGAALALLAAASLCTGLLMDAALVRQGLAVLRDPAAAAAAAQQSKGYEPLTANEERGMDWLARHAAPGELAATNRIHTGLAAEGLSNVYSGLSGCAFYMESFKYAVSNMGVPAAEVQARLAVNTALFDAGTTAPQLRRLAAAHGIRYLAYCPRFPGSDKALAGFARVYESADLVIYRID